MNNDDEYNENDGGGWTWHHLAVLGAVAFVLGVLAWNIARSGS